MTSQIANANTALRERLSRLPKPALWVIAARAKTLGLSITPVAAGTWAAAQAGAWRGDVLAMAMAAAAAIQIGTNLWNDAADAERGVDSGDRLGPPRMTVLGLLDAAQVRRGAAASFLVSALIGLWLAWIGGWPIVAIGLVSLALGYFYSMGPWPLSATPLGEVLVIGFFGIVAVGGTVHLHGLPVDAFVLSLGLVTGLPAAAVLMINNHRDRAGDTRAGRRTLAIVIGESASRMIYAGFLVLALIGGVLLSADCAAGMAAFAPAALLGVVLIRAMVVLPVSAALNRLIPGTAGFQVLLVAGIAGAAGLCG